MQVLSVRQPWAWAIARGCKAIENRTWDTAYRGILAIHASLRVDLDSLDNPLIRDAGWDASDPAAGTGGIVAVVSLADICTAAKSGGPCGCGPWADPGACHWRLGDVWALPEPIMTLGQPGLWTPVPEVAAALARTLSGQAVPAGLAELVTLS
jgi:ASCH domain